MFSSRLAVNVFRRRYLLFLACALFVFVFIVHHLFGVSLSDDDHSVPASINLDSHSTHSLILDLSKRPLIEESKLRTASGDPRRGLSSLEQDPAEEQTTTLEKKGSMDSSGLLSTPFNIHYLPSTVNTMLEFYLSNLAPKSLSYMLGPRRYAAMQCSEIRVQDTLEYTQVVSRIPFGRPPPYKMPFYYADPFPLCGRYLLRYLLPQHDAHFVPVLRTIPVALDRTDAPSLDNIEDHHHELHTIVVETARPSVGEVYLEHCGLCIKEQTCLDQLRYDILIHARLSSEHSIVAVDVVPNAEKGRLDLVFTAPTSGLYALEVKLVHINGSSNNASYPHSLGVIGIRASDHNRKSFKYNLACDLQRHVYGSPMRVLAKRKHGLVLDAKTVQDAEMEGSMHENTARRRRTSELPSFQLAAALQSTESRAAASTPFCTAANHTSGYWLRFSPTLCATKDNSYCFGDPSWLSDACAFNDRLLWVPSGCKYKFFTPPNGPRESCLKRNGRGFLLLVGDSVIREYSMNCRLFDFRSANLMCLFNNIALEGQHYSLSYARDVSKVVIDAIKSNKVSVFASNLGIHHMIGPCSTEQWTEFIDTFVDTWRKERIELREREGGNESWRLEKAIWIGPPSIHYARKGMGFQRGALWDEIAWTRLAPLGFRRLFAIAPTLSRTEATWDGLHYASQKGKVQSPWRNRAAAVLPWNGGVANMLFTMLLNLICNS